MPIAEEQPLVVRSRVTPWGFLVALPLAVAFSLVGAIAVDATGMLSERVGVFVAPPGWLVGALLLAFALFLFLVGVSELVHYVKPSVEVIVDKTGVSTFGLLGERRFHWADITMAELGQGVLSLKVRGKGRLPPPDVRIHFNRLDLNPHVLIARVRAHRPDLVAAAG